ncbi:response regulator receiver modulated metal-depenent phosphohydrolase [Capsulimonas corticalis]|uniref:Response regulator receiver modulated metal-depenent phosphohydrolase n=1 Tax=Capsulimonas corticalis TaxID=2219043 RepID=A0A402CSV0_9BACT|nr:HD domain-containing phosphohydrolase [Capsulimonas corticalis]BDI30962.1 response regulator receiver modulated metal-depenent phosphohydrolase [Capsulimonas corticalis]
MSERILFVDDDANILSAYQRHLRKQYDIDTALGGEAGLQMIENKGPYSVIVTDMGMPGMNGVQFLTRAKGLAPDTVRMMLTGNADLRTAVEALHRGNIFRYLVKPAPPESMALALEAGVRQYHLINAERDLLEKTLQGSIRVMIEILSVVNPESFGRVQSLKQQMRAVAQYLKLEPYWKFELGALLSQIGLVTVPAFVVRKSQMKQEMTEAEQNLIRRVPEISRNLLSNIPRLEPVAEMIYYQKKNYDGTGFPKDSLARHDIPVGARILRVLHDLAYLEASGLSRTQALAAMGQRVDWYDNTIIEACTFCLHVDTETEERVPSRMVMVAELRLGQKLASDIYTCDGTLLISSGHKISETLLEKIRNFMGISGIQEPIEIEVREDHGGKE